MTILIKGMEMPKNCDDCFLGDYYCEKCEHEDGYHMAGGRPYHCPLVEVVRCKDCRHRPYSTEPGKTYGLTIEAPDGRCPCYNEDDGWYSWVPDNEFFCFYGKRKEGEGADIHD